MTNPNRAHESGHWRAYIDSDPMGIKNVLWVMKEDYVAEAGPGGVSMTRIGEGLTVRDDQAFMSWSALFEDDIIDMWKAIGKALDVWSEQPGRAYAQGFAEGEAKVLREWNESLRGKALD